MGGKDGFDKFAFRRVFEFEIQTFNFGVAKREFTPQLNMKFGITRKAFQVVKNDNILFFSLGIQISEQGDHTGAFHKIATATDIIRKHRFNV
ncbi:MAG: hypothetical protein WA921_12085 [Ahrensia sp.]